MGTKVISTLTCFFNGRRYRPGKEFELPDGVKPSADMRVVGEKGVGKGKAEKAEPKGPQTFSEIAKQDSKAQGADSLV